MYKQVWIVFDIVGVYPLGVKKMKKKYSFIVIFCSYVWMIAQLQGLH